MISDNNIFSKLPFFAQLGKHNNNKVIWVSFPKDDNLIQKFKTLKGAHWSNTEKITLLQKKKKVIYFSQN